MAGIGRRGRRGEPSHRSRKVPGGRRDALRLLETKDARCWTAPSRGCRIRRPGQSSSAFLRASLAPPMPKPLPIFSLSRQEAGVPRSCFRAISPSQLVLTRGRAQDPHNLPPTRRRGQAGREGGKASRARDQVRSRTAGNKEGISPSRRLQSRPPVGRSLAFCPALPGQLSPFSSRGAQKGPLKFAAPSVKAPRRLSTGSASTTKQAPFRAWPTRRGKSQRRHAKRPACPLPQAFRAPPRRLNTLLPPPDPRKDARPAG